MALVFLFCFFVAVGWSCVNISRAAAAASAAAVGTAGAAGPAGAAGAAGALPVPRWEIKS